MIELKNPQENNFSPENENYEIKRLRNCTFVGLFNSFDSTVNRLAELKKQGSTDVLTVKKSLTEVKEEIIQIYLSINAILTSYKHGFSIEEEAMKCDFCPDPAETVRCFHKWCKECFEREFGGIE